MRQEQIRRSTRPRRNGTQPLPALEVRRARPKGDGRSSDELLDRIDALLERSDRTAA